MTIQELLFDSEIPLEEKYELLIRTVSIEFLFLPGKTISHLPNINKKKSIIENILIYYKNKYNDIDLVFDYLGNNIFHPKMIILLRKYGGYVFPNYERKLGINTNYEELANYLVNNTFNVPTQHIPIVEEFKELYTSDKLSDKKAIDIIINSFNRSFIINPNIVVRDLKTLINIKKEYPLSCVTYDEDHITDAFSIRFADEVEEEIYYNITISNPYSLGTLNHELTHCIHYYYKQLEEPESFDEFKIDFSCEYINQLSTIIEETANRILPSQVTLTREFIKYIRYKRNSLKDYKDEIEKDFIQKYGSEDLLNEILRMNETDIGLITMLDNAYEKGHTYIEKKDYKKKKFYLKKRLYLEYIEFREMLFEIFFPELSFFYDFINSYTKGKIKSNNKLDKSKYIFSLHDESYFEDDNSQFTEMLADYIALKKSPKGEEYILILKNIFDIGLFNLLDEYYINIDTNKGLSKKNCV